MNQQKYPSSIIKVGVVLYQVNAYYHEGKSYIDVDEWHVKSIRKKRGTQTKNGRAVASYLKDDNQYVNLVAKIDGVTWVRLSRKIGDIGWSPTISPHFKKQFAVGRDLPLGIYTTKLQAFKYAMKSSTDYIESVNNRLKTESSLDIREEYEQELAEEQLVLKALKAQLTRLKNKSKA